MAVIGWDIGGVNTKLAVIAEGAVRVARAEPFEVQREPGALPELLRRLASEAVADGSITAHAVTMTAELSQRFRTKREGVCAVLESLRAAFPTDQLAIYAVDGRFLDVRQAAHEPVAVSASNWAATARIVADHWPCALLIDIGTTTTDIIPIADGRVAARGRTDPERLASGELVYLGAVRTPVEAIVHEVPLGAHLVGVSAEGFALAGDVHVWRGALASVEYATGTPDGRPVSREFVRERLARVICADRELVDDAEIDRLSAHIARAQAQRIATAIARVRARHERIAVAVVAGVGEFLAAEAARVAGLATVSLAEALGADAARCAPAAAVALLLERQLASRV